jgi:hypothetical protein
MSVENIFFGVYFGLFLESILASLGKWFLFESG